jgi:FkbM family methyltransferase
LPSCSDPSSPPRSGVLKAIFSTCNHSAPRTPRGRVKLVPMRIAAAVFRLLPVTAIGKKRLKYFYFKAMAVLGIQHTPALLGLDLQVRSYLPEHGVFVEVGANDGVTQSNSWFYEQHLGWSGLLIEPVPYLSKLAAKARRAPVANVALGAVDGGILELYESDLTTTPLSNRAESNGHAIQVPVRSLSSLLDEHALARIDFFSLDVEGFELEVLAGLDMDRHAPRAILVETAAPEAVQAQLGKRYRLEAKLSVHDYLFLLED